jgi:hypothetical protein
MILYNSPDGAFLMGTADISLVDSVQCSKINLKKKDLSFSIYF